MNNTTTQICMGKTVLTGLSLVGLRFFLAYEFLEAGLTKLQGSNWFESIQTQFPFPFNLLPTDLNWAVATAAEILFPILLILGFFTRFSTLGLMILTAVAWYAVHAGLGYNVCNSGYKMPLIYLIALFPLFAQGAGIFSVDTLLRKKYSTRYAWLKFF